MYLSLHITVYTFNLQLFSHGKKHFYQRNQYKTQFVHVTRTLHYTLHHTLDLRLYRIYSKYDTLHTLYLTIFKKII